MKFECANDKLVSIDSLLMLQNPKNPNIHTKAQIDRLAKIIEFAGQRSPIVVSNRSGFIIKGHGRLLAMHSLGWTEAAVDYQDYVTEASEYQDMVADNEIARWSELDRSKFTDDLHDIDFGDIDLFGIQDFSMDLPAEEFDPSELDEVEPKEKCPNCGKDM
jgi:hypothetical protein